jgi:hypothetical protein
MQALEYGTIFLTASNKVAVAQVYISNNLEMDDILIRK